MVADEVERYCATVLSAFKARGLATDQDVIAAGGPSTSTMTKLRERNLAASGPRGDVHRKVDTAAGWMPGSSRALWEEGEPPDPVPGFVTALGEKIEAGASNEEVLAAIRDMADAIREMNDRLGRLERGAPGE